MTVRIEAGEIRENPDNNSKYVRLITAWDAKLCFLQQHIFADTKDELEIIDHENFMKE